MNRPQRSVRCLGFLAVLSTFVTSCGLQGEDEDSRPVPQWSISFRWTAPDGVDLDSPSAQMVRATIESNTIAEFLNRDYGYPGWRAADDASNPDAVIPHQMREGIGTAYLHLIPYQEVPRPLWVVCKDMSETTSVVDGKYPLPNPNHRKENLEAISVQIADAPSGEPKNDEPSLIPAGPPILGPPGRAARPTEDVFSNLVFVHYQDNMDNYRALCLAWAESRWGGPQPPKPSRTENEPPEIHPFSPGWSK